MNDARLQLQALLPVEIRHGPWVDGLSLKLHELPARTPIYAAGEAPTRVFFIAKGWVASSLDLNRESRPISNLRLRGDVVGLTLLSQSDSIEDVVSMTGVQLVSVPLDQFRHAMRIDPSVAVFVHSEMRRDLVNLQVMNAIIGQMKAPERLAFFLYIMLARSRRTYRTATSTLSLPLTQEEIGQILGLTNVSVNRALRTLENEQLIRTGRQSVTFIDENMFADRLKLDDRLELIDVIVGKKLERMRAA